MQWYAGDNVPRLDWPAQSPDLSATEHVWDEMDCLVKSREEWSKSKCLKKERRLIPVDVFHTLVKGMPERLPQSVVFHVSQHPQYPDFHQCVTFGFFSSQAEETAYNLFCVMAMYFIPLMVICFAYSCILFEISSKSRETKGKNQTPGERYNGRLRLRRSDMTNIERARSRTLRMTITIVAAFIWCWTPYVVMTLWYMFDRESAEQVDGRLQDGLFIMAVSNSCMNPLVYGSYAMNFRRECSRCFGCVFRSNAHLNRKSTGELIPLTLTAISQPSHCREHAPDRVVHL
ncbi:adipokinetic hormone/corazonin-related peptide receptor variant I-like [Anabrus simplex]|uniref:adipokinetic hormone/corazonin-related peptide receptor variant I-like n=1 Tax=Anabrus simplex TaxID=316456 RepID=UPI0035A3893F